MERDIEGAGSTVQAELGGIFLDHAVEAAAAAGSQELMVGVVVLVEEGHIKGTLDLEWKEGTDM